MWTQISVDEELGLVYLPVEDPTSDFYGGHRPGNNLFGDSLVCVDLKTGQRKWHFQIVHHPIWDYDLSSAPILADITVNGRAIKAVALPTKEAFLYVFDRVTGQPVWPIEEHPVPKGDVPGEWYAPTQPFPTKPPAYGRQAVTVDDLVDFTPEMRAQAIKNFQLYKTGPMFVPPIVSVAGGPLAALTIGTLNGGTNWPGAGYDPETHVVFAPASNASLAPIGLIEPPKEFGSDLRYVMGTGGQPFLEREGPGFGSAADAPQRRPHADRRSGSACGGRARGCGHARQSPRGAGVAARQTTVRPSLGHQSRSRRDGLAGAAWRDTRCGPESSCSQGDESSENRTEWGRRTRSHKVAGHHGRSAGHHDARASARSDAARVRQGHRPGSRGRPDAGSAERLSDDLRGRTGSNTSSSP